MQFFRMEWRRLNWRSDCHFDHAFVYQLIIISMSMLFFSFRFVRKSQWTFSRTINTLSTITEICVVQTRHGKLHRTAWASSIDHVHEVGRLLFTQALYNLIYSNGQISIIIWFSCSRWWNTFNSIVENKCKRARMLLCRKSSAIGYRWRHNRYVKYTSIWAMPRCQYKWT